MKYTNYAKHTQKNKQTHAPVALKHLAQYASVGEMSTKKGEKLERRVIDIKRVKGERERETEKLPITGNYRIETNTVIRYLNTLTICNNRRTCEHSLQYISISIIIFRILFSHGGSFLFFGHLFRSSLKKKKKTLAIFSR